MILNNWVCGAIFPESISPNFRVDCSLMFIEESNTETTSSISNFRRSNEFCESHIMVIY